MTTIWGFDPSKYTGFGIYSPEARRKDGNCAHVICGVLEVPQKADHYFTGDQIAQKVQELFVKHGKPDFAVLEEQALANIARTSADAMLYPWIATTAIVSVLSNWGVPYGTLPAATWRKAMFGSSFKPPQKPVKKNGAVTMKNDWKTPAIQEVERLGVVLPKQKALADDAAEAVAIAMCWEANEMKFHAGRYQQPWMDLRMRRNDRQGVAA